MYGPKWPFLLMYGAHDMRHTGIPQVDGLSTDPREMGRHSHIFTFLGGGTGILARHPPYSQVFI